MLVEVLGEQYRRGKYLLRLHGAALGDGVYITTTLEKAVNYAKGLSRKPNLASGVILKLEVELRCCKKIERKDDPQRQSWYKHGFDSAWAPAGVVGEREENQASATQPGSPSSLSSWGIQRRPPRPATQSRVGGWFT